MARKKRWKKHNRKLEEILTLDEVKDCLDYVKKVVAARNLGPGSLEFSFQCSLAAVNGLYPRVKLHTAKALREKMEDFFETFPPEKEA